VVAYKGSGIYVREFRPIVREGINRLGRPTWPSGTSVWSAETEGRDLTVDQVEISEVDSPKHVQALLGLDPAARAVLRSRRYVIDGKPVLLSRSWLPADIASGTPIAQRDNGRSSRTRSSSFSWLRTRYGSATCPGPTSRTSAGSFASSAPGSRSSVPRFRSSAVTASSFSVGDVDVLRVVFLTPNSSGR